MTSVAIIHNHPIHYQHLLFRELGQRGMDFEVLFLAASSAVRMQSPLPDNGEYRYSIGHQGSYETCPRVKSSEFIWRSLNRLKPGVVILCGWADAALWSGWAWAELHGARRILWAESNAFDHRRREWKELPKRLFIGRCDAAHVYGTASREYLEQLGMGTEKIRIGRAIVNTALFQNRPERIPTRSRPLRLLYCGRLSEEKNVAFLLRALAGVQQSPKSPRLTLTIVGHGPSEESLRILVQELGLTKIVEFVGSVPQPELPAIFQKSDVLVLPSTSEPWGLVVNEAMVSGLPVAVSSRCGCVADLVRPETGWSFSPSDIVELTRLLTEIVETPTSVLDRMGRAGRLLAEQYSPQRCATDVLKMVNDLVPAGGRDPLLVSH